LKKNKILRIDLRFDQYLEVEKLNFGALLPVKGFMGKSDFHSVLKDLRLSSGEVFPIPVVLDLDKELADLVRQSAIVNLFYRDAFIAELVVSDVYSWDKHQAVESIFQTSSEDHPGVARFMRLGNFLIGGQIRKFSKCQTENDYGELSPLQTQAYFKAQGWKSIVGFQTRNVPHRAHEYLQRSALEVSDGLFIQPLIGSRRQGDFAPNAIMTSYRYLIDNFYPEKCVLLSPIRIPMRYAGPREALFHALIRRNYGCTHFIVGRDHAGVGNFYGKYEAHDVIKDFESEIDISIFFMSGPYYCGICGGIVSEKTCRHFLDQRDQTKEISGTWLRKMISEDSHIDSDLVRPEMIQILKGLKVFLDETDEY